MNNLKEAQRQWATYAYNQAKRVGISDPQYPVLFVSKLMQESSFNPTSRGAQGGVGIAQLDQAAAERLGVDPHNPIEAIDASLRIDAQNYEALGGNLLATVAAYHVGQDTVAEAMQASAELPIEAQTYLNRILTIHHPQFVEMFGGDLVEEGTQNLSTTRDLPPNEMVASAAIDERRRTAMRQEFQDVIAAGDEGQVDQYLNRFVQEYSSFGR